MVSRETSVAYKKNDSENRAILAIGKGLGLYPPSHKHVNRMLLAYENTYISPTFGAEIVFDRYQMTPMEHTRVARAGG
jgi:hypothetical protein